MSLINKILQESVTIDVDSITPIDSIGLTYECLEELMSELESDEGDISGVLGLNILIMDGSGIRYKFFREV